MRELLKIKINSAINSFLKLGDSDLLSDILISTNIAIKALKAKKKIIFCGNGGSAADSQHLSAELVGKFKKKRKALNSISLTTDTSAITSIGNDMGFDKVFSRQLEAVGEKGDVLFALTTSGKSANILNALKVSKKKKLKLFYYLQSLQKKQNYVMSI
ncbi:MAG: phosphoheptose isomerase [Candidatus Pelagibacter sp.]|nr:phosphoheptose isomerase [Candidatus Pelagibacter sp.]|tara:strand:+ start:3239 stop:3712 length:474 start_codon:yes stop_codon:yes gene_type:complete